VLYYWFKLPIVLLVLAWLLSVAAVAEADAQNCPDRNKPVQIVTEAMQK